MAVIAAVNRCATQNQMQSEFFHSLLDLYNVIRHIQRDNPAAAKVAETLVAGTMRDAAS